MAAHLHDIRQDCRTGFPCCARPDFDQPEWGRKCARHPVTGYEILRKVDDFKEIAVLVRHHHERWDGRG